MVRVVVLGTGLIGTSVALALRERGASVWLADADPEAARLAAHLGAGELLPDAAAGDGARVRADVAVIAVPPSAVADTLAAAQARALAACYTDVASVKQLPVEQARARGCDMTSYVPGHPLAGREKHGPAAARADLFLGRTWALCPEPETSEQAVAAVTDLAAECGAVPLRIAAAAHDRWVALVSHAPHLVAAAMAARLESAPPQALDLAGQGLRDVTRIAAGDTALWTQILAANAGPVAEVLAAVAADLAEAARMLTDGDPKSVATLLDRGQAGVARIPGKHGGEPREFTVVQVVIPDQPGELTRLFDAAGRAGVNIEDVRIEHSPGPAGRRRRTVRPARRGRPAAGRARGGRLAGPPLARPVSCCSRLPGGPGVPRPVRVPPEEAHREQQAAHRPGGQDRPDRARVARWRQARAPASPRRSSAGPAGSSSAWSASAAARTGRRNRRRR